MYLYLPDMVQVAVWRWRWRPGRIRSLERNPWPEGLKTHEYVIFLSFFPDFNPILSAFGVAPNSSLLHIAHHYVLQVLPG